MDHRTIRIYGDSVLREKAKPVGEVTDEIRELVQDMARAMFEAPGIGLAAPQVGVPIRLFVIDPDLGEGDEDDQRVVAFIDPVLSNMSPNKVLIEEGCLSIPEVRLDVERPESLHVEFTDASGERRSIDVDGMFARVIQHEYDHLDGILFTDRINPVRKRLIAKQLKQMARSSKRSRAVV